MKITKKAFGKTKDKQNVTIYRLTNSQGNYVEIMDLGVTIQALVIDGIDVVLGYDTVAAYEANDGYLGACVGRVANRINNGQFTLNGVQYNLNQNDGKNHLHGGDKGFDKYVYDVTVGDDLLSFTRISPDMEEGYPGTLKVMIEVTFTENNALILDYTAKSDKDTIVSLTNHAYFNLSGHQNGTILDHELQIDSDTFCEIYQDGIPTGHLIDVENTPFDFREAKEIGHDFNSDYEQLKITQGYDHNFILNNESFGQVASVYSPQSNITMEVNTNMPGIQIYTSNMLSDRTGKDGAAYHQYSGICLETQYYPDGINQENFTSPILKANDTYHFVTSYQFY